MPGVVGALHPNPGARTAAEQLADANGNATYTPIRATNSYTNAFPSLQGRYEIQPTLIARATWSSTIARPGFNQSNASQTIDLGSSTDFARSLAFAPDGKSFLVGTAGWVILRFEIVEEKKN